MFKRIIEALFEVAVSFTLGWLKGGNKQRRQNDKPKTERRDTN